MLYTMEANHVLKGLQLMYKNGNPTKWDVLDKPATPICYVVNDQLSAQYFNDQLLNAPTKIFVGLLTVNLYQGGANGVIYFYDPYNVAPVFALNELPNVANTPPRDFTVNIITSKLEVSVLWSTKFSLHFFGYAFEYKPL